MASKGAQLDERDADGDTAIHIAARGGDAQALLVLLNMGASIDSLNKNGRSPLHVAVDTGNDECACLLIDMGANADALGRGESLPPSIAACLSKKRRENLQFDEAEGMKSMFL